MAKTELCIRLDLANGTCIGPGKIALLEAIQAKGSITAAARHLGMCYRRAWLLVQDIYNALQQPAVTTQQGGRRGSEGLTHTSAHREFQALVGLRRDGDTSWEKVIELYHSIVI